MFSNLNSTPRQGLLHLVKCEVSQSLNRAVGKLPKTETGPYNFVVTFLKGHKGLSAGYLDYPIQSQLKVDYACL